MSSEEDVRKAGKLLEGWKEQVSASFSEGSVIRTQLEKSLSDATERVAKVEQAIQLRKQIDQLPDGAVKLHMSKALAQLEQENGIAVPSAQQGGGGAASAMDTDSGRLQVVVLKGQERQSFELKDLHRDTTLGVIKAQLEELAQVPSSSMQLCATPTAAALGADDSPLRSVHSGDTLYVRVTGSDAGAVSVEGDDVARAVVSKAEKANVQVKGPRDALSLAVHVLLLSEGLVAMAAEERQGGPKGFAPPIRPLPESRLVPSQWNADPTAVSFTYRHDKLRGRDIRVSCVWMDETLLLEVHDPKRTAGPLTLQIPASQFVDLHGSGEGSPGRFYKALGPLSLVLREQLVKALLPADPSPSAPSHLPPASVPSIPAEPGRRPFQGEPPFPGMPVPHPGLGPIPVPGGLGGYGGRPGGLVPDFDGDLQPGGGFMGPGGGNLMGPNHPIFSGQGPQGMFPGQGGYGMPAPRFDPYGPVIPPTRGGPPRGVNDPNDPRNRRNAFRDPDPDHLPPPGSNMYL